MDWNQHAPPPDREERRTRAPLPSRPRGRETMGTDVDLHSARRNLERAVRRQPLRSAAIALACGFVMGRLLA